MRFPQPLGLPAPLEAVRFGSEESTALHQRDQKVKGTKAQGGRLSGAQKTAIARPQFETPESMDGDRVHGIHG
jgi:hypothetical protein